MGAVLIYFAYRPRGKPTWPSVAFSFALIALIFVLTGVSTGVAPFVLCICSGCILNFEDSDSKPKSTASNSVETTNADVTDDAAPVKTVASKTSLTINDPEIFNHTYVNTPSSVTIDDPVKKSRKPGANRQNTKKPKTIRLNTNEQINEFTAYGLLDTEETKINNQNAKVPRTNRRNNQMQNSKPSESIPRPTNPYPQYDEHYYSE